MKSLFYAVSAALLIASPLTSFAQQESGVTRAQVRAELVQVEQAGYKPGGDENNYPATIQAATAKVDSQGTAVARAPAVNSSPVSSTSGSVQSVAANANDSGPQSTYFGA